MCVREREREGERESETVSETDRDSKQIIQRYIGEQRIERE